MMCSITSLFILTLDLQIESTSGFVVNLNPDLLIKYAFSQPLF